MSKGKIPTAEEYFNENIINDLMICSGQDEFIIKNSLVEFAKFHVEAALESAKNSITFYENDITKNLIQKSIIKSYPLSNIK